ALRRGEIDIALGLFENAPSGLARELLFEDRYCAIARRGNPRVKGKISPEDYLGIGHVFAMHEDNEGSDDDDSSEIVLRAVVPRWLTVLMIVAGSDALGTVPLRFAERHAKTLKLQVIKAPYLQNKIRVSYVRRDGVKDAGSDWFLEQIKAAAR